MAKKKKNDMTNYYILIGVFILIAVIVLMIYYSTSEMNRSLKNEGYETEGGSLSSQGKGS